MIGGQQQQILIYNICMTIVNGDSFTFSRNNHCYGISYEISLGIAEIFLLNMLRTEQLTEIATKSGW